MKVNRYTLGRIFSLLLLIIFGCNSLHAQLRRSEKSYVRGGVLVAVDTTKVDSLSRRVMPDSLLRDSLSAADSLLFARGEMTDSLLLSRTQGPAPDTLATPLALKAASPLHHVAHEQEAKQPFFSDSMSLSKMSLLSAVIPGYGQIYNKQYWKLPILYGAMGAGIYMYANENKTYKPLKEQYDILLANSGGYRDTEINTVQAAMVKSNTRRQLYMGATIATYLYFMGDAVMNYSTNEVSDIKKATTLSMICPGAGQIYNKSYWRVPIVLGMFASTIYVYDWNNRGYQRFKTAYALKLDYDNNPENYPDGSIDEFGGSYSTDVLQNYRDSYRRNRDLALILTAGAYLLQVLDAHVDAHLKNFDISDDLSLNVEPAINYSNMTSGYSDSASYGLNINLRF
ncbi:MAG: DUF5683 domain-containing protein [Rikenellaceae bacterium]